MITVSEARQIIQQYCSQKQTATLPLTALQGRVTAIDIFAPADTPPFAQSAMDGYAFSFTQWDGRSPLQIVDEVQAGENLVYELAPQQAVRIFTGAPVPAGADTVVIQEKVTAEAGSLIIHDDKLKPGSNVRPAGSQTQKGELALPAGTLLTAPAISFLASMGIGEAEVYRPPSVSIIVTGNELVPPGSELSGGKIFESNSYGLSAALQQLGLEAASIAHVNDQLDKLTATIKEQLHHDIIIITGGISTGDYDYTAAAMEECGIEKKFLAVQQKPGKPFCFGIHQNSLVFALPGNPAAVLTCFYAYIVPVINHYLQRDFCKEKSVPLLTAYSKKPGYTYFLKGKTSSAGVEILPNQESYTMNSFAIADCLIELAPGKTDYAAGETVKLIMIN